MGRLKQTGNETARHVATARQLANKAKQEIKGWDSIKVYKPGSWVMLADNIPATISQIQILGPELTIKYEVVWWGQRDRHIEWVSAYEVTSHPQNKYLEVGFHSIGNE